MNSSITRYAAIAALVALWALHAAGQGVSSPLLLQGLDQSVYRGARAMAMGGAATAASGDAGALFVNPAVLSQLQALEFRAGMSWTSTTRAQTQAWIPNRFYPNFTLLMESMTGGIKDPVVTDPRDRLQRPYDDLSPNWDLTENRLRPAMGVAALPIEVAGMKVVVAAGVSQAFDLDYYYQNNNGLDPNIGLYRPQPIPVLRGSDTLAVRWFSSSAERKGAVYGITPGFSVDVSEQVSVGASVTFLTGSSDDFEMRFDRGLLSFDAVYRVQNYPIWYGTSRLGTSNYSGVIANLGVFFREQYFSLGMSIKPPATITRDWERSSAIDTAGAVSRTTQSGSDKLSLPLNYSFGLLLTPSSRWRVAVDYVIGQLGEAEFTPAGGAAGRNPWLSANILRSGVEYRATDWLALRAGYQDIARPFAPEGTGLIGEPVSGSVYSAGAGVSFDMLSFDLAYQYQTVVYQELWETNVNENKDFRHGLTVEVSARF